MQRRFFQVLSIGDLIKHKKCKFRATLAQVNSTQDAQQCIAHLSSLRTVSGASHKTISAWRIGDELGHFDCGESGAGKRLALLLQNTKSNHLLVAVSRWYGGSPLGSTRFKVIASCAKQILVANKSLK